MEVALDFGELAQPFAEGEPFARNAVGPASHLPSIQAADLVLENNAVWHYFNYETDLKGMLMTTLSVTARGQVTFKKGVLKHLGIRPGGKIRLDLLPDGRALLEADEPEGSWDDLKNFFAGKTNGARFTIEELNDAIGEAGAAAGMGNS